MLNQNGFFGWAPYKVIKYIISFALRYILRILWPIKFSKGPIKFQMTHENCEIHLYLNGKWAIGPLWASNILGCSHALDMCDLDL